MGAAGLKWTSHGELSCQNCIQGKGNCEHFMENLVVKKCVLSCAPLQKKKKISNGNFNFSLPDNLFALSTSSEVSRGDFHIARISWTAPWWLLAFKIFPAKIRIKWKCMKRNHYPLNTFSYAYWVQPVMKQRGNEYLRYCWSDKYYFIGEYEFTSVNKKMKYRRPRENRTNLE